MTLTKKICCLIPLFILSFQFVQAQLETIPVNNDKAFLINSKVLNEPRSIWIHLPFDYNSTNDSYPVIYLLDGEGHFKYVSELVDYLSSYDRNRIPEMIVVAILNVDRTRDFTPIHSLLFNGKVDSLRMANTGGGTKFLQFIQNELVPHVDKNFRTAPYRILAAHSLAGLFGLYTKEMNPDLFKSTILMSPAIYGGNTEILDNFKPFLKNHQNLSGKFFISIGNENTQTVDSIVYQLKMFAPKTIDWDFKKYEDENHFSVTYKSMFDALKFIYKDWFIDNYSAAKLTSKEIQLHFDKLSDEFGYTIKGGEDFLNSQGYKQLRSNNIDAAIEIFKQNIKNHPESWNAYDSMGEAYMIKGERHLAIENYEKSISLNPNNDDGKKVLEKLKSENNR
ncbi:alpha/beta hydrolase-fold protein [Galbibacter pacificus]|uniref:Alpha/beta hydrolase-fold protein n=1 Tax=Galbibacter pacificus TaxID=2996052 RepID=A0ABT6FWQ4_9FLAO|nr:alpha/beta hydrolase-fold protein [Galbibacter pacificus]MDG3584211.1 alpha/beta hydrolase-fold protein [Galbibacter pacificus]MDG3587689.1 alpha/beta hydrolase-fold protein [Galbibacter pacificus]